MKRLLIHIILVFVCGSLSAQDAVTNSGNLQIHSGASVAGFGNFTNTTTAVLTNNGNLYLKANISNSEAGMPIGTGTLYINGSSAQSLNGTQEFITLNLVSNNAAGITLNNNLSVNGTHTFTNGIITTSATPNYLIYQSGSSYSGDADTRHVNGWVKKLGTTNFIFPLGNGTVERTVAIGSLSASSEFNARYLGSTANSSQVQLPLRTVDVNESWPITKVAGGTATVTLNWDRSKVYFPNYILPDLAVAGYNGSIWADNGGTASGNAATTGTITSNSISTFNSFTFGSKSWVLPVTLISFTARKQDNYTLVEWQTEKENNIDTHTIERSDDGSTFYQISKTSGRNSGLTEQYYIHDNAPIRTIAYYRLRTTDNDRKEKFSRIVAISNGTNADKLVLFTNPVHNKIILFATGTLTGNFKYQLSTMNGQLIQKGELTVLNGGEYEIPFKNDLQPGTYSLKVTSKQQFFYFKLLKL
jgi:hypothetical protein